MRKPFGTTAAFVLAAGALFWIPACESSGTPTVTGSGETTR